MSYSPVGVEALVAIVDHGTFEAAARALHVTPSAVSQRVRALESEVGRVLVLRAVPCRATPSGATLVRLGRQRRLLDDEAREVLADEHRRVELTVALNADSLATWFRDVLADLAAGGAGIRLVVEDQAFSASLLRSGEALAAVTSDPHPVQGCVTESLGTLRYAPAAAPQLAERWRRGRRYDWRSMPVVVFNDKDTLPYDLLRERGLADPSVVHQVPTFADYFAAVRLGLGWGMIPEQQLTADVIEGRLVRLDNRWHRDVHLHWQRWRIDSATLQALTESVRRAARAHLVRGPQASREQ